VSIIFLQRDLRKLEKVRLKKGVHSDDITCLTFSKMGTLLSGSEDNLINVFSDAQFDTFVNSVPELTVNVNQPIQRCRLIEAVNLLEVFTTVEKYCLLNDFGSEVFSFCALNELFKTEYLIDSYFNPIDCTIELYCGNQK
jgi:WD40 repeat protein